jgi:hypothetical protein
MAYRQEFAIRADVQRMDWGRLKIHKIPRGDRTREEEKREK